MEKPPAKMDLLVGSLRNPSLAFYSFRYYILMTSQIALEMQIAFFLLLSLLSVISVDPTHLYKYVCSGVFNPCKFSLVECK